MVGSPTAAAGTPPYPLLGSGRERFSGVARSCSARESPTFHRTGFSRTVSGLLWGGNCAKSSGACVRVPVRPSFGSRLASAVRSRLSLGPSAIKLRAVRPAALHGNCRHDQPCLHTHAPADSPAWKLPSIKLLCRETGPSEAASGSTSPSCRGAAWSGEGNAQVLDLRWATTLSPSTDRGLRTGSSSAIHVR